MTQPQAPTPEDPSAGATSDRLYTAEQLAAFTREQEQREATRIPVPGSGGHRAEHRAEPGPPEPAREDAEHAEHADDPWGRLLDPLIDPVPVDQAPVTSPYGAPPLGPPPVGPPGSGPPSGPPAAAYPTSPPPAAPPVVPQGAAPAAPPAAAQAPVPVEPEVRRFMTATDFLDRRDSDQQLGPATWGWRGRVRRWSGGTIKPAMGPKEVAYERDRATIQRDFDGPRTIAFINPKGGAAKTTGVLAAGYTFGTVRGGGVVAWDNNETRGTLGIRGTRSSHRNTTRELLEDLERFKDVYQSRIGDLGAFVRSQGDAHFDVLASDERPDVTGMIHADDFREVHQLLERFYRVILVDTGNNMRAENWLAAAEAADLLVVTSTVREDTGYSGLWMLDALQDAGLENLKHRCVTVLSDPSPSVDDKLAADLVQVYEQRTRGVHRVPYDPVLVAGGVVPYAQLSEATRMSWLKACAAMSEGL
jgi:MinD-like ATPase involved in chromosome partitioning or flagellar assembly